MCAVDYQVNPEVIDSSFSGRQMDIKISYPDARVTLYCADLFELLESVVCG